MPAKAKMQAKDPIHRELCEEWKARRIELGLTQQDVADELGIEQPSYAAIENGKSSPTTAQITRVSAVLKLRPKLQLVAV